MASIKITDKFRKKYMQNISSTKTLAMANLSIAR